MVRANSGMNGLPCFKSNIKSISVFAKHSPDIFSSALNQALLSENHKIMTAAKREGLRRLSNNDLINLTMTW